MRTNSHIAAALGALCALVPATGLAYTDEMFGLRSASPAWEAYQQSGSPWRRTIVANTQYSSPSAIRIRVVEHPYYEQCNTTITNATSDGSAFQPLSSPALSNGWLYVTPSGTNPARLYRRRLFTGLTPTNCAVSGASWVPIQGSAWPTNLVAIRSAPSVTTTNITNLDSLIAVSADVTSSGSTVRSVVVVGLNSSGTPISLQQPGPLPANETVQSSPAVSSVNGGVWLYVTTRDGGGVYHFRHSYFNGSTFSVWFDLALSPTQPPPQSAPVFIAHTQSSTYWIAYASSASSPASIYVNSAPFGGLWGSWSTARTDASAFTFSRPSFGTFTWQVGPIFYNYTGLMYARHDTEVYSIPGYPPFTEANPTGPQWQSLSNGTPPWPTSSWVTLN